MGQIVYWHEREPLGLEYVNAGIARIELVHMTLGNHKYFGRKSTVVERVRKLSTTLPVLEVSLNDFTSGVSMSNIVVAGWKQTECVMERARYLMQVGAALVIVDFALTAN